MGWVFVRAAVLSAMVLATSACLGRLPPIDLERVADEARQILESVSLKGASQDWAPIEAGKDKPTIAAVPKESAFVTKEGLYIRTGKYFVSEWGYFIPRNPESFVDSAGDPSYDHLGHGVYRYYIAG
jgi:hypothetical protein